MKTCIIWNEIDDLKYLVLDGDYRKYHNAYINDTNSNENLEEELTDIIFNSNGEYKVSFISIDEFAEEIKNGASLIECGFIP